MEPGEPQTLPEPDQRQLPMWHRYRVELYPHYPGLLSGIIFGNNFLFLLRSGSRAGSTGPRE